MDWNVLFIFGSLTLVLLGSFYFNYQGRRDLARAIRLVVEKADMSDPALAADLLKSLTAPPSDLRRGTLFIAVGLAFAILAIILDQPEALRPMLGVAAFPTLVGCAYLLFHYLSHGRRTGPSV